MAPAKKTAAKAEAAVKEIAAKATPATKSKRTDAAKTAAKKEVSYTSYVQFGDSTFDVNEIMERAEKAFKNDNKRKRYDEFRIYIKPEDSKAYYVAKFGDKEYRDSVDL